MKDDIKCCFCLDLRSGSFISGYVSLVWSIVVSAIFIWFLIANEFKESSSEIIIVAVILGFNLIRLILIIILLIGLYKNNRRFINAYLISNFLYVLLGVTMFIAGMVLGTPGLYRTITAVEVFLNCFFMVVIRVYSVKMNDSPVTPPSPSAAEDSRHHQHNSLITN